jgi:glucose/mannose transport system substrate-binding protein
MYWMEETMRLIPALLVAGSLLGSSSVAAQEGEVIHWWTSNSEAAGVKVFAGAFNVKGGKWVDSAVAGGSAARAALLNRIAGGNPPAAGQWVIGPVVGEMVEQGVLNPVTSVTIDDMRRDFSPQFVKLMTREDKVYAVAAGVSGDNWMWINAKVYKDLGLQPPKSWDEFLTQAEKIRAAGIIPLAMGGDSIQEAALFRSVLLGVAGMEVYKKIFLDHDTATAASEPVVRSFATFLKLKTLTDPGITGRKWNAATSMVIKGQAALQVVGTWAKGEFAAAGKAPGVDYLCALAPGNDGYVMSVATIIFPKTQNGDQIKAQNLLAACRA